MAKRTVGQRNRNKERRRNEMRRKRLRKSMVNQMWREEKYRPLVELPNAAKIRGGDKHVD